jgi:lipooligosaccharide transport system permease protein
VSALSGLIPSPRRASAVWRRDLRVFSRAWRTTLLPQFLDPILYLLAMGFGLGTYLSQVEGIPYERFIGSGMLASAVMWAASFESTWNVYFRMEETRLYDAMLTTPVEVQDVVAGEAFWAATRATVYGTAFLLVVTAFGFVESAWAVAVPIFLALGGLTFALFGLAFTSLVARADYFSFYYTLFITPLFLFSGIFYPLDGLPDWVSVVAWFTPLYHLVEVTRGLILHGDVLGALGHGLWLAGVCALLFWIPVSRMRRRLVA